MKQIKQKEKKSKKVGIPVPNTEMLLAMKSMKKQLKKRDSKFGDTSAVIFDAVSFLESTPSRGQTIEQVRLCISELEKLQLGLSVEKIMMLVNLRPQNAAQVQLIVESPDEEIHDQILSTIPRCLPPPYAHTHFHIKNEKRTT